MLKVMAQTQDNESNCEEKNSIDTKVAGILSKHGEKVNSLSELMNYSGIIAIKKSSQDDSAQFNIKIAYFDGFSNFNETKGCILSDKIYLGTIDSNMYTKIEAAKSGGQTYISDTELNNGTSIHMIKIKIPFAKKVISYAFLKGLNIKYEGYLDTVLNSIKVCIEEKFNASKKHIYNHEDGINRA
jgi:hypothetical protein